VFDAVFAQSEGGTDLNIQALMLTGEEDTSGVAHPERADDDDDT
jgi:hypothetical protein